MPGDGALRNCEFVSAEAGWRCKNCGYLYTEKLNRPPRRNCPVLVPPRTQEQIEELVERCRSNECGAFDSVRQACRLCGCESERRRAWESVLRVGRCPRKLW